MPISAAFRSSRHNECYVFVNESYVRLSFVPNTRTESILEGPKLIRDGFPVLARTTFENGIDCAFDTDRNEAYIFHRSQCALIDYAPPNSANARFLVGQVPISAMFPCLKNTAFEYGIDAAIRSTRRNQVYIFKGDQYARIDYATKKFLNGNSIRTGWSSLANTCFVNGLDAAFAIHVHNEVYIFKGDHYARLNFSPCADNDRILGRGVLSIYEWWTTLRGIIALGQSSGGHSC